MTSKRGMNLTQSEMLERLCPPPFDQRNVVPKNATIVQSPAHRWWRSDSPIRAHERDLSTAPPPKMTDTRGVLGWGHRDGPGCFHTSYKAGSGTAAHTLNHPVQPPSISGYSGFVPGKYAGNIVSGTYNQTNLDSEGHLSKTAQASRFGRSATGMGHPGCGSSWGTGRGLERSSSVPGNAFQSAGAAVLEG